MPNCQTNHAEITGIHSTLGSNLRSIDDDLENFGGNQAQIDRIKKTIGLNQRYVVSESVTSLDLCEQAALRVGADALDAIIFVTQTPDHFQPCNATKLHDRLGLEQSVACFDVSLGCSGWVYGIYLASLMIESGGCGKILVAAGDTMSRCVHANDRSVASLFGDAGSATIVEKSQVKTPTVFSLRTDGAGWEHIQMPAGGYRQPPSNETSVVNMDSHGNSRSAESLFMDGAQVFSFAIKQVPTAIKEIMSFADIRPENIDRIVLHQANRYIISNIVRRVGFPLEKAPCASVERYGNLSSASIPTAICDEVYPSMARDYQILCSGFGVGLSWASMLTTLRRSDNFGISRFGDKIQ